jgi:long-chain acyl-CoA synthetase
MALKIHTAPASSAGKLSLGRTLPSLLDEAADTYPNPTAFNNPTAGGGWLTMSNGEFRTAADEIAVGLLESGLERGDRLAMFMDSDLSFSLVDFGSLVAGVLNVPLYTTFAEDNLVYVTGHSEAKAMVVTNPAMLARFAAWAGRAPSVRLVVLATGEPGAVALPEGVRLLTLDALREAGRTAIAAAPNRPDELRDLIDAQDVATLIYTSGTTGQPKGVMLTHENISSNVLGSFSAFGILGHQEETILTYLPLTHIFARMVVTAHITWGHSVYYSDPDHLVEHLPKVRPTVFASVPRVLEKVYDKVTLTMQEATGLKGKIGGWAMAMAPTYETGSTPSGLRAVQFGLADKLVYSKLREKLGLTRVKAVVIGGAALRPALSNAFNAFGVEVAIAEDGEILTRGPHVMKGYYKADDLTAEVIDADGWFHTGDIGEFTPEGYLTITDRKKALFKLSTGKYVIPQPIENALMEHALIEQAVVVGSDEKYATALIFPGADALAHWAKGQGIAAAGIGALVQDPKVAAEFERLVAEANQGCDPWSQVKRFRLVPEPMTVDNGLLTPKMSVKRSDVSKRYATDIALLYKADVKEGAGGVAAVV